MIRLRSRGGAERQLVLDSDDQVAGTLAAFATAVRTGVPAGGDEVVAQARLLDRIRRVGRCAPSPATSR